MSIEDKMIERYSSQTLQRVGEKMVRLWLSSKEKNRKRGLPLHYVCFDHIVADHLITDAIIETHPDGLKDLHQAFREDTRP